MRPRPTFFAALALAGLVTGCATAGGGSAPEPTRTAWSSPSAPAAEELILVTFAREAPPPVSRAGSVPRSYGGRGYAETGWEARKARRLARRHGLEAVDEWPIESLGVHCVVYRVPPGLEVEAVLAAIAAEGGIDSVQPMGLYELEVEPDDPIPSDPQLDPRLESAPRPDDAATGYDDPYLPLQHGLESLGLPWAHRWATGAGVRVGVVDTAVDGAHPDLEGRVEVLDFVGGARDPSSGDADHGTAVAGVIASAANNGQGIVGVAPGAEIQALRACWPAAAGPSCNTFTLARALSAVLAETPSRRPAVLNLSLSGAPDPLIARLLRTIVREGIAVVAAVGARPDRTFPASLPEVIAVDRDDRAAPGGPLPGALLAPGADILTTLPREGWNFVSGTSLAAAHVSGAAALVLELAPGTPPGELRRLLQASGATAGSGHVDACLTLSAVRPVVACRAHGPAAAPPAAAVARAP